MLNNIFISKEKKIQQIKAAYNKFRIELYNSDSKKMFRLISKNKKLVQYNPNLLFKELANKGAFEQAFFIMDENNIDITNVLIIPCDDIQQKSGRNIKDIQKFKLEMLGRFLTQESDLAYYNAEVELEFSSDKEFLKKVNKLILNNTPDTLNENTTKAFLNYSNTFLHSKLFSDDEKEEFINYIKLKDSQLIEKVIEKVIENYMENSQETTEDLQDKIKKLRGKNSNHKIDKIPDKKANEKNIPPVNSNEYER